MKEAYYFSHDSNARHDPKSVKLIKEHNWLGYGLYWALIEKLRAETDYKLETDYDTISYELRTDYDRIKSIVEDFNLFTFDEKYFWSESLLRRMELKEAKSKKARESVMVRWAKQPKKEENNTNVLRSNNDSNTSKVKEKKRKKEKEVKNKYGNYKNVSLTDNELDKLKKKFNSEYETHIDNLSEYIRMKGNKYKDHYVTILNWDRRNKDQNGHPKSKVLEL